MCCAHHDGAFDARRTWDKISASGDTTRWSLSRSSLLGPSASALRDTWYGDRREDTRSPTLAHSGNPKSARLRGWTVTMPPSNFVTWGQVTNLPSRLWLNTQTPSIVCGFTLSVRTHDNSFRRGKKRPTVHITGEVASSHLTYAATVHLCFPGKAGPRSAPVCVRC